MCNYVFFSVRDRDVVKCVTKSRKGWSVMPEVSCRSSDDELVSFKLEKPVKRLAFGLVKTSILKYFKEISFSQNKIYSIKTCKLNVATVVNHLRRLKDQVA